MEELLQLLRERAANLDDLDFGETCDWTVEVNSADVAKVSAATKQVSQDQEEAWRTATQLRDAIMSLGYRPHGTCTVGIISKSGTDDQDGYASIIGWRGYVELIFGVSNSDS